MADNPLPTPPADPVLPPLEGIVSETNGQPSSSPHVTSRQSEKKPAGPSLKEWAVYRATQLGALLALWAVVTVVFLVFGFERLNAVVFGAIVAVVGSFFLRPLLPIASPAEKYKPAVAERHPFHQPDSFREIVETVVFVIVLVLMLKTFVAEAFVIPTGSMAETLYGYQKLITCPSCGHTFPVNCSAEVDPSDGGPPTYVNGCSCPNCRQKITIVPPMKQNGTPIDPATLQAGEVLDPGWRSGDRVLVSKFAYDLPERLPDRLDVVVFKFPGDEGFPHRSGPVKQHSPMNYIKRLVGLPGETIAIYRGKLYVLPASALSHPDHDEAEGDRNKLTQLWKAEHMRHNDPRSLDAWGEHKFAIVRKPPAQLLSMMRIVYDNDRPAKDLTGSDWKRWTPAGGSGWSDTADHGFQHDGSTGPKDGDLGWIHYRHILRGSEKPEPQLITDFMGYNTWEPHHGGSLPGANWASDLIVECNVQAAANGEFALELSRGPDRFQAKFDLSSGTCTLYRIAGMGKDEKKTELKSAPTRMKGKGKYHVRFANADDRLIVWVDGKLSFGDGVEYNGIHKIVPQKANDLERPVSIGAKANVTVTNIKVFRDTYYTTARGRGPATADVDFNPTEESTWKNLEDTPVSTYYVQPDHFLCMGDNSPESSDGRSWGLVPRRLLLGRALLVYYPFQRAGRIR